MFFNPCEVASTGFEVPSRGGMTKKQAAKILEDHNIWRRGAETKPTDPKLLGEAIEVAVKALRKGKP